MRSARSTTVPSAGSLTSRRRPPAAVCAGAGGRGTDERGIARQRERLPGPVEHADGEVEQPGRVGLGGDGVDVLARLGFAFLHNLRPLHPLLPARGRLQPRAGVDPRPHERRERVFAGFRVRRFPGEVGAREQRREALRGEIPARRTPQQRRRQRGARGVEREARARQRPRQRERVEHITGQPAREPDPPQRPPRDRHGGAGLLAREWVSVGRSQVGRGAAHRRSNPNSARAPPAVAVRPAAEAVAGVAVCVAEAPTAAGAVAGGAAVGAIAVVPAVGAVAVVPAAGVVAVVAVAAVVVVVAVPAVSEITVVAAADGCGGIYGCAGIAGRPTERGRRSATRRTARRLAGCACEDLRHAAGYSADRQRSPAVILLEPRFLRQIRDRSPIWIGPHSTQPHRRPPRRPRRAP